MVSKTPTKAERRRFLDLQDVGCIACRLDGRPREPADIHHILDGGRRIGHSATIPLCPWHHRGISELPCDMAAERFGPSLARRKRDFIERYGTEAALLEIVDDLLEKVAA